MPEHRAALFSRKAQKILSFQDTGPEIRQIREPGSGKVIAIPEIAALPAKSREKHPFQSADIQPKGKKTARSKKIAANGMLQDLPVNGDFPSQDQTDMDQMAGKLQNGFSEKTANVISPFSGKPGI